MSASIEEFRELLDYDPATGQLIWKERDAKWFKRESDCKWWNTRYAGKIAGCFDEGYVVVKLANVKYGAHRIIWAMANCYLPAHIDHIDGNKTNNLLENLREATNAENGCNRGKPKNNTSGFKGVAWNKRRCKYCAYITVARKRIHLGYFNTPESAHSAYCAAANKYHGEFANHGGQFQKNS